MKKIVLTMALGSIVIATSYGQGTVGFNNGTTTRISTNSVVGGANTGFAGGLGGFYYALFFSTTATTVSGSSSNAVFGVGNYAFNDAAWTAAPGVIGTNIANAGRFASSVADANGNTVVQGVPGGNTAQFLVIGWSANIGTTLASVISWYNGGNVAFTGWLGESIVGGTVTTGAGLGFPPGLFGTGPGNITGFTLGQIAPVPEPTTLALAGLGAASLLIFRRRKQ